MPWDRLFSATNARLAGTGHDDAVLHDPPLWLRIIRFPLTRLIVLGGALFSMMAISGGYMEQFKGDTLKLIAIVTGMVAARPRGLCGLCAPDRRAVPR